MIMVADSGIGISSAVRPYIFEAFFTIKGVDGSGLGLAQVYGIIKRHGGEVALESQAGNGTSFMLYLPPIAADVPIQPESLSAQVQEKTDPQSAKPHPLGDQEAILLVEDNATLRLTMSKMLTLIGYRVLDAADGVQAIKLYQQHSDQIALVITDLTMPNMSGIELVVALRELNPTLNVIMMTGYQPDFASKSQLGSGETIWLQKPIPLQLLRQTVRQLIGVA